MKIFEQLPKTIKKTVRYIRQDVQSLDKLEEIERTLERYIKKRKQQLKN